MNFVMPTDERVATPDRRTHRPGGVVRIVAIALALAAPSLACAESPAPAAKETSAAQAGESFDVLVGRWIRPDGGYTIAIDSVATDGKITAEYFNPSRLPFAKAQASRAEGAIKLFFEIQAGGYGGSTYDLSFDPASERLVGVYYQAVAKEKFDIFFERAR